MNIRVKYIVRNKYSNHSASLFNLKTQRDTFKLIKTPNLCVRVIGKKDSYKKELYFWLRIYFSLRKRAIEATQR